MNNTRNDAPQQEAVANAEFCPHCNPCRNSERIAKAEKLNVEYDAMLRSVISYLAAGGYSDLTDDLGFLLIDPAKAEQKLRWGIDNLHPAPSVPEGSSVWQIASKTFQFLFATKGDADEWQQRAGINTPASYIVPVEVPVISFSAAPEGWQEHKPLAMLDALHDHEQMQGAAIPEKGVRSPKAPTTDDRKGVEQEENYDCPLHGKQDGPDCPRC